MLHRTHFSARLIGYVLTGLFVLHSLSCRREPEPLSIDKMSHVLLEMHVAESYSQYAPKDSSRQQLKNQDSLARYYALILKENKITEQDFKRSMAWYKKQPELLDSIYQQILADLSVWQSRINKN